MLKWIKLPLKVEAGRRIVDSEGRVVARGLSLAQLTSNDAGLAPSCADETTRELVAVLNAVPDLTAALNECVATMHFMREQIEKMRDLDSDEDENIQEAIEDHDNADQMALAALRKVGA